MENTLKNKAAFMAQYWGHNLYNNYKGEIYMPYPSTMEEVLQDVLVTNINEYINHSYLELKSIEDITDDDAEELEIGDAISFDEYGCWYGKHDGHYWSGGEIDYLREKGYAVPYRGLSVQKQIEYGWVKLKNKES
ncbi:hypothetical protein KRE43_12785 [Elizabethkingia meningoseptica]|uniref:hypothetical protein n=1 Tax=Elizabethkingia meningoseptica TaxID=238 RepID=UPI0023B20376|nr:hypothetical protein [Elizabethkingia meningoseptica]MDE5530446.1 hypothetical protein [Elizabethkingia meningoseptica]MDE5534003.1 hypothetical protein [Elizabethkingia meningoseptica]MDE5542721.1 hypothetical protein [Elizabethkingia meningoseptica]